MNKIAHNKIFHYTTIAIIIIMLMILIIKYIKYIKTDNNGSNNNIKECLKTYTFKEFTYDIPCEYTAIEDDDKGFQVKTNNWSARIEPFIDRNNEMITYKDTAYDIRIKYGNNVNKPYDKKYNDKDSIIFEDLDNSSVICYYDLDDIFDYEITLYNNDKSFNIDALDEIIPILDSAMFEANDTYIYDEVDFESITDK